ncbi:ribosome biogenesis GTP-binding protein YihA/YsxC [Rickettsiaceae bacterium]|nr:ribosome biogenesis GTP-binding protein YihA/YsxC [Rickettsiaceae bacterium]
MSELGTKIFKQEAKFIAGVARTDQFPKLFLPQVAFLGKSNVGKSSLINAICRRKSLARVSHTPGRTQQINFFSIIDKLLIADLPGYGFAKISQNQRVQWEKLIMHYLEESVHLKMINLLIDARRNIKENDIKVIKILQQYDRRFQIVLTKTDKASIDEEFLIYLKERLSFLEDLPKILATSSKSGIGIKELQRSMTECLH